MQEIKHWQEKRKSISFYIEKSSVKKNVKGNNQEKVQRLTRKTFEQAVNRQKTTRILKTFP